MAHKCNDCHRPYHECVCMPSAEEIYDQYLDEQTVNNMNRLKAVMAEQERNEKALHELKKLIAERDRYRKALEEIINHAYEPNRLPCEDDSDTVFELQEMAREALKDE